MVASPISVNLCAFSLLGLTAAEATLLTATALATGTAIVESQRTTTITEAPTIPWTDVEIPIAPPIDMTRERAEPRAVPRERAEPRAIPRTRPYVGPLPIYWPERSGRGLPLTAPNPINSIWLTKPLVRATPAREPDTIPTYRSMVSVPTGQAVHHVTPLFLGGPDSLDNLSPVWISYHTFGHVALRIQPHLSLLGWSPDLYSHPVGTPYIVAAIV